LQALHETVAGTAGFREQRSQERLLRAMFEAAIETSLPDHCMPPYLPAPPRGRTVIVGAGKAAAAMARTVEEHWRGPISGIVVTRYGHAVRCKSVTVLEAGHPVPDQAGVDAAARILETVSGLCADDLVICLISGGGSALLPALPPGITLDDERTLFRALLKSGATISEMNCVRKHISLIKGGRLAAAVAPARVVTLVISDVPGDDVSTIASGPTVPDPTTRFDALAVLRERGIEVSAAIRAWLEDPASETPKPGELAPQECYLVATPQLALEAAARVAQGAGYTPIILGDAIEGEAREVGLVHAGIAHQVHRHAQPAEPPCVLLSGGETTVTVRGKGRGGRNVEFLLGLLLGLQSAPGIAAIAADTDGIDGTEDNAGAIIDEGSLARARQRDLAAGEFLRGNDAYSFFQAVDDLVITGPTLTNVNDFRAIIIEGRAPFQEHYPR
jgi:hydroxypyruvate reductase